MKPFAYYRPAANRDAIARAALTQGTQFLAGGISQIDFMKEGAQRPTTLIDVARTGMDEHPWN